MRFTTLISTADLAARLGDADIVIIDVRHDLAQPDAWGETQYRAGHLPGAAFAHVDRDLSGTKSGSNGRHPLPTPEAAAEIFGRLGIGPNTRVVAYDQGNGVYAARLWWMLHSLGHNAAAVLDGGFDKWMREQRSITIDVIAHKPAVFTARPFTRVIDADAVQASIGTRSVLVLDARAPDRFRGEVEPLDPVAGHIPGAVNRPFARNLGADGAFKPAALLRADFLAALGAHAAGDVVHTCGSGITACHNALAMEVAGLPGAALYAGSWSEWCADPARPIARGN